MQRLTAAHPIEPARQALPIGFTDDPCHGPPCLAWVTTVAQIIKVTTTNVPVQILLFDKHHHLLHDPARRF